MGTMEIINIPKNGQYNTWQDMTTASILKEPSKIKHMCSIPGGVTLGLVLLLSIFLVYQPER